jgi:hypothetical protein
MHDLGKFKRLWTCARGSQPLNPPISSSWRHPKILPWCIAKWQYWDFEPLESRLLPMPLSREPFLNRKYCLVTFLPLALRRPPMWKRQSLCQTNRWIY